MKYNEKKISEFLEELSSQVSVPGGGSASALVGALGAALLGMVSHFTLGKKGYEKLSGEVKKILFESYRVRDRLSRLIDEDVASYLEVSRAQRAAKLFTRKESKERMLKGALRRALASSLNICKASHRGLLIAKRVTQIGNKNLKSDAKAAALFLSASFHASFLMSEANLRWLKDDAVSKRIAKILLPLRKEVERTVKEIQKER